jgi:hypothetical protein
VWSLLPELALFFERLPRGSRILDLVLHMLEMTDRLGAMLELATGWTRPGGWILVADTRKNRVQIRGHFQVREWTPSLRRADLMMAQKPAR